MTLGPKDFLGGVGEVGGLRSIGQEIYRMFKAGEISESDYFIQNARLSAMNMHWHKPEPYPPMPEDLAGYVKRRLAESQSHDSALGMRLGKWCEAAMRAIMTNADTIKHLLWCEEKLSQALPDLARACRDKAAMLGDWNFNTCPAGALEASERVRVLDARERMRGSA